ncbi:hypothetical protein [Maricaulis parjimensis]|uniref:hypothetical protein n=1 Tax=Maricaulis parjimensis TaxID=144023 RepID=UPI00193A7271|nr:hypothetical protein [Maricaulis parjimensis]
MSPADKDRTDRAPQKGVTHAKVMHMQNLVTEALTQGPGCRSMKQIRDEARAQMGRPSTD